MDTVVETPNGLNLPRVALPDPADRPGSLRFLLEEGLPGRFGGAPTDYQLVEEEAADGPPRLLLLVHPRVGPLDPGAVAEAFLTAISRGSGVERVMGLAWRSAGLLQVERRPPLTTSSGKILHLHQVPRAPR